MCGACGDGRSCHDLQAAGAAMSVFILPTSSHVIYLGPREGVMDHKLVLYLGDEYNVGTHSCNSHGHQVAEDP